MSNFALLEHIDDDGQVEDLSVLEGFQEVTSKSAAKAAKAAPNKKQGAGRTAVKGGGSAGAGSSQIAHSIQQTTANGASFRADDYYRAFEHVYKDSRTGETILRFHKSNIVVIKQNGDVVLNTYGWYTFTTLSAMNDALHAIHIKVSYQGPVSDGSWAVRDDAGLHRPYHDGIVLPATKPAHKQRGAAVLKAYAGGAEVPVYVVVKPAAAAAAAGAAGGATAPATARARGAVTTGAGSDSGTAVNFAAQLQQQQLAALKSPAKKTAKPGKSVTEQLLEAINHLDIQDELDGDDEHLCVVCLHRPKQEVLVPCGHMVLCSDCCKEIIDQAGECPMCREKILDHCVL